MNTDLQDLKYKELTEKIIKIFYSIYSFGPEPEINRKVFDNFRK